MLEFVEIKVKNIEIKKRHLNKFVEIYMHDYKSI